MDLLTGGLLALLALGVAATSAGADAQTYYVDSENGDDARAGRQPAEAWRSLDQVNTADLRPGDTVRFRRGGQWRGTLRPRSGSDGAPITYTSYGEGEKPLLLGSVSRGRPEDWEQTAPGIWATRAPEYRQTGVLQDCRRSEWYCHREGSADLEMTTQTGENGVVYGLECRKSGDASNRIQLWGPFPEWDALGDAGFVTFRFRARCTKPFKMGAISIRRGTTPWTTYGTGGGTPQVKEEWQEYVTHFQVVGRGEQPRLHCALGGALPEGSVFEFQPLEISRSECSQALPLSVDVGNVVFDHGKACGWKKWGVEQLSNPLDYFYDGASWRVFVRSEGNPAERFRSIEMALNRHIVNQGSAHHVLYDGLAVKYGAAHGFGGGDTHHLTLRNCDIAYIGGGHQFTRADGHPVRFGNGIEFWGAATDNLVEGCRLWEIYDAALTNQGRGPTSKEINITYRDNLVRNCEYSFEYWNNPETAETRNIQFVNNTCVDAGVVWSHAQRPDRNGSHLMFYTNTAESSGIVVRHNVFSHATEWGSRFSAGWDPRPEIDGNLWHLPSGHFCYFFREKLPAADAEGYRKKTGFDAHSVFADPGFVDARAGDYRLRADSPARALRADGGPVGAAWLWEAPR